MSFQGKTVRKKNEILVDCIGQFMTYNYPREEKERGEMRNRTAFLPMQEGSRTNGGKHSLGGGRSWDLRAVWLKHKFDSGKKKGTTAGIHYRGHGMERVPLTAQ